MEPQARARGHRDTLGHLLVRALFLPRLLLSASFAVARPGIDDTPRQHRRYTFSSWIIADVLLLVPFVLTFGEFRSTCVRVALRVTSVLTRNNHACDGYRRSQLDCTFPLLDWTFVFFGLEALHMVLSFSLLVIPHHNTTWEETSREKRVALRTGRGRVNADAEGWRTSAEHAAAGTWLTSPVGARLLKSLVAVSLCRRSRVGRDPAAGKGEQGPRRRGRGASIW